VRYLLQFPAGLGGLVEQCLHQDIRHQEVVFRDDSAVLVTTTAKPQHIAALPYLKNAFAVVTETRRGPLPTAVPALAKALAKMPAGALPRTNGAFRTMMSVDGQLVGVPRDVRARLEAAIAARTGGRLQTRGGSGDEYWVVGRRELDTLLLGRKVPMRKPRAAPKGALGPEVSDLLVRASDPSPDDVFLDPFAGTGSLVLARLDHPARQIIYSDLNLRRLRPEFRPELARARGVSFLHEDARELPSVDDATIDAIVTDPPWGEHEELAEPFPLFAAAVGHSMRRVLKPGAGRFVMLVTRRLAADLRAALVDSDLVPRHEHEILVNGHPATALVGARQS